jgi:acetyl esterase/lipase
MRRQAVDILTDPPPPAADERLAYGREPLQFGDLRRTDGDALAVVVHGGSWKATYNLIHMAHLCIALREAGIATFSVEYRRVGDPGGGWPGSLQDVLLGVEFARGLARTLVLVGHSAGGHLSLLAAAGARLPVVAVAAVCDPQSWDNPAVGAFFDGRPPPREASPLARAPLRVPQILVHGTRDETVPFEQSERLADASRGEAELVALEGAGHFEPVDPLSSGWTATRDAIRRLLG